MLALLTLHRAGHDLSPKPKATRQLRQREVLAAKVDPVAALRKSAQAQTEGFNSVNSASCTPQLQCVDLICPAW